MNNNWAVINKINAGRNQHIYYLVKTIQGLYSFIFNERLFYALGLKTTI